MKKGIILLLFIASASIFLLSFQKRATSQSAVALTKPKILKALIMDGQNNHGVWPKTTAMMKDYLEQTGLFQVDIARTAFTWQGPHNDHDPNLDEQKRLKLLEQFPVKAGKSAPVMVSQPKADPDFKPDFSKYDVVISNFGWTAAPLPKETQVALEKYIASGGGLIVVHAADNSFPEWKEFNKMIGLGAWGNRSEKDGPYIYYNNANELVRDTTAGGAGSHGKQYEFMITIRDQSHPITKGMPQQWMHAQDELYDRLRGPAENIAVLATAYSDEQKNASPFSPLKGTNRNEPMMLTVKYGNGRIFQTPLGHTDYSMECVGFIVTLQRAAEWVATGNVSQTSIPKDFPTAEKVSQRTWTPKQVK
jgi:type 1 glutamine amidotransferase